MSNSLLALPYLVFAVLLNNNRSPIVLNSVLYVCLPLLLELICLIALLLFPIYN